MPLSHFFSRRKLNDGASAAVGTLGLRAMKRSNTSACTTTGNKNAPTMIRTLSLKFATSCQQVPSNEVEWK